MHVSNYCVLPGAEAAQSPWTHGQGKRAMKRSKETVDIFLFSLYTYNLGFVT